MSPQTCFHDPYPFWEPQPCIYIYTYLHMYSHPGRNRICMFQYDSHFPVMFLIVHILSGWLYIYIIYIAYIHIYYTYYLCIYIYTHMHIDYPPSELAYPFEVILPKVIQSPSAPGWTRCSWMAFWRTMLRWCTPSLRGISSSAWPMPWGSTGSIPGMSQIYCNAREYQVIRRWRFINPNNPSYFEMWTEGYHDFDPWS